jgi:hypothetical protein
MKIFRWVKVKGFQRQNLYLTEEPPVLCFANCSQLFALCSIIESMSRLLFPSLVFSLRCNFCCLSFLHIFMMKNSTTRTAVSQNWQRKKLLPSILLFSCFVSLFICHQEFPSNTHTYKLRSFLQLAVWINCLNQQ